MQKAIKELIEKINTLSKEKPIKIISHNDTDGITSAAIFSRALQRWNKKFSLQIVKNLEKEFIENLPENHVLIFLDLASGSLPYLEKKNTEIFILDHHEIMQSIPSNITIINPVLFKEENISSSALCYLFARELSEQNKDLANLAVIGMIGDVLEKNIGKIYDKILKDAEVLIKKGILLYPATRPLDRVLENSLGFHIPGVTGSFKGVLEILRESGIERGPKSFKSLAELTEKEMSSLLTAIMLKKSGEKYHSEIIGNIYLTKFFNRIEDARELSAMINACSRMDYPELSLGFCLGNKKLKKDAEKVYTKYRQSLSSALGRISQMKKISGKNYTIINAQDKIKDTMIGTIASIMSFSPSCPKGMIIITMADCDTTKIKVSARVAGRNGRNVREILARAVMPLSGEVGGHPNAAGCIIQKDQEQDFIDNLKNILDVELIKV
ncbi:MAG: DHH family phosphoesterase [Nanoarchaeota archaeon]|nr:DHH family phosphoesterase [Nanoarchaeota archaeon]